MESKQDIGPEQDIKSEQAIDAKMCRMVLAIMKDTNQTSAEKMKKGYLE